MSALCSGWKGIPNRFMRATVGEGRGSGLGADAAGGVPEGCSKGRSRACHPGMHQPPRLAPSHMHLLPLQMRLYVLAGGL